MRHRDRVLEMNSPDPTHSNSSLFLVSARQVDTRSLICLIRGEFFYSKQAHNASNLVWLSLHNDLGLGGDGAA